MPPVKTPVRRTQTERSAESREKLIGAAIELLGTRGYTGTTLAEIGRVAGVSRGLVTHHFGNKEQCMQAVVGSIHDTLAARLTRAPGQSRGLAAIDNLIDEYLRGRAEADRYTRAMYVIVIEACTTSPGLLPAVAENDSVVRRLLVDMLDEAVADGEIEPPADADELAVLIFALMRGVLIQHLADPEAFNRRQVSAVAKQLVHAHLGSPAAGDD
ncbi:TetR/AcrR family transcriptional regulator [Nocardia nova]|uniref:TetR/AcrR family transcriptional regulator n=1 Tax=Nocardia nova TaxID=37330 RepID=UPI0033C5CB0F